MRQLDRLDVMSRKVLRGRMQGERRSKKRGQSVEFADYRNYVVGDDLRRIDWNLYARLDKLFLRLFLEEEDLSVTVLLDTTASMDFGEPNKLLYAKRLAAALGYIALTHYNRLTVHSFTNTIDASLHDMRGRRPVPRLLEFLDAIEVTKVAGSWAKPEPGGTGDMTDALRYLAAERYDCYAIQVLAPQETDPVKGQVVGDLRLRDIEDGDVAEVSVTAPLLRKYKANLQAYCEHVREACLRRGLLYMLAQTDVPFEDVVLKYLRQRGLVG